MTDITMLEVTVAIIAMLKRHCAPLLDLRAAKSAKTWYFPRAGKSAGRSVLSLENPNWYGIWGE